MQAFGEFGEFENLGARDEEEHQIGPALSDSANAGGNSTYAWHVALRAGLTRTPRKRRRVSSWIRDVFGSARSELQWRARTTSRKACP